MDETQSTLPPEPSGPPLDQATRAGPPTGFGKGVNDYYNHFVTVVDAKATAFLAADLVLASLALSDASSLLQLSIPVSAGVVSFLGSGLVAAISIYPRLPRGVRGLVFWEDVRRFPSEADYATALRALDATEIELLYAEQNYHVASVLHRKNLLLRISILLFILGMVLVVSPHVGAFLCQLGPTPTTTP